MSFELLKNHWLVAMKSSQLAKKTVSIELLGISTLFFRHDDKVIAIKNLCPHRGAPLSEGCVKKGSIQCAYHGWSFSLDGHLLGIPGNSIQKTSKTALLTSYNAKDQDGYIWIKLSDKEAPPPCLPTIHTNYPYIGLVGELKANLVDVLENFLDPLHTHFVHSGLIRSKPNQARHLCHVYIKSITNGYEAIYREQEKQSGLISFLYGRNIIESSGRILSPGVVEIEYRSTSAVEMLVNIHVTPVNKDKCRLFIRTYLKPTFLPIWTKIPFLFPFQLIAYRQDKRILELQKINLDLQPEFQPIKSNLDIMRNCIENVLKGEITSVDSSLEILL